MGEAEVLRLQQAGVAAKDDGALDDVLQLAHVAGPVMGLQRRQARVGNAVHARAVFAGEARHELMGEKGDVLLVLAQRGT